MISPFLKLFIFVFLLPLSLFCQSTNTFYIDPIKGKDSNSGIRIQSPFKTIERAKAAVRLVNAGMKNDIYVYLRQGEYDLRTPVIFGTVDGGTNGHRVIYSAYKHENVLVSGGLKVTGWKLFDKSRNIYAATLASTADSRQLYVNGLRATRARSIGNEKRRITADSIGHLTSDVSMLKWKNPSDIECVYREIWTNPRCGIASILQVNDTTVRIKMKQPGWMNCRNKGITSTRTPWYFENAYELLDEAGEWYLDKSGAIAGTPNTLFYKPQSWESMTNDKFVLPLAEKLFVLKGESAEKPVSNLRFEGLKFSYTTWLRPNSERGHSDAQNNVLRENKTGDGESMADGAALTLQYAHNVDVSGCSFTQLGCAGINMYAGCQNNSIQRSLFYDLSGTAIQMGDYKNWKDTLSENSYNPANPAFVLKGNKVLDNHIECCGVEYRSATGIAAAFPVDMLIKGNTILNMPYSGMHIGWGWTTVPQTVMKNNVITQNDVENVMLELADGGSIYTLGGNTKDKWSYITENYMNRVMWGQCVYMDNGSSFYKIDNNVYKDGDDYNLKINSGSHDISATGIYSNKKKDLVGKTGCYNYHIDSTQFFSPQNKKVVAQIRNNAGSKKYFSPAWQTFSDLKIYEAENAELSVKAYATAGIGTHVFGYSGMGFLSGFDKNSLSAATFTINVSKPGTYNLKLKYSAGNGWEQKLALVVNGAKTGLLDLKNTPSKDNWSEYSTEVILKKGMNTIACKMEEKNDQFLFLDRLVVTVSE